MQLAAVRSDDGLRAALIAHGLDTIRRRHTCAHRVDELLGIVSDLQNGRPLPQEAASV
jgi:Glycosyl transferases group 1